MVLPVWELSISHSSETYSFTLSNPAAGALIYRDQMRIPSAIRDDIVAKTAGKLPPADDPGFDVRLSEFGDLIFRRLLPPTIQEVLAKMDGGYLAISTDDPAILWEATALQGSFLGLKVAVARRMIARKVLDPTARPERGYLEMLVIADPLDNLRQAGAEADSIASLFAAEPLIRLKVLRGTDATTETVLNELSGRGYDIVHYAGHVASNQPGEATLKLADGEVTAAYLAGQLAADLPQIVFINGCSSGALAEQVEARPSLGGEWIASMAETFLARGVQSYVGTLWDVADVAASRMATSFYAALLDGQAVGDALLAARRATSAAGAAGWAAYLLYGQPTQMIAGVQPVIERRQNLAGLRSQITSDNEVVRRQAAIRLGTLGLNEATSELATACEDPSQAVRWRAVEGLAKIGTGPAITELATHLHKADRDAVLQILVVARGTFSTEHWAAVSTFADPAQDRAVRANAIRTLSLIPHDDHRSRLASYLEEDDPLIQWVALNGLARLGRLADPVVQTFLPDDPILEERRQQVLGAERRPAAPVVPDRERIPIILDCDAGLDDCVALALAATHPDCSLQAVSIVGGGNVPVAEGVETATAFLQLCGRQDVPVLGGLSRGADQRDGEQSEVFKTLADVIAGHDGRCVLVATGPLTNVAVLLRAFPHLVDQLREIIFLGGAFRTSGNVGPVQEANVSADPEAASAVLRSGGHVKVIPLDVSQQLTVNEAEAARLEAPGSSLLHQQLAVMLAPLLAYYRIVFARDNCPIHDVLAVALALRPDLFRLRPMAVTVELRGDVTRGTTVIDERPEAEGDNLSSRIEIVETMELAATRALVARLLYLDHAAEAAEPGGSS